MAPLQIDRALGVRRYLFGRLANPWRARHPAFWGSYSRMIGVLTAAGEPRPTGQYVLRTAVVVDGLGLGNVGTRKSTALGGARSRSSASNVKPDSWLRTR